jgi:2'-5' RNA ligase
VRTFVAVWPDDATLKRLSGLELASSEGLRMVGPAQRHITLRFLGDVDDDVLPKLIGALRAAAAGLVGPVRCEIGPSTAWFGDERVLQIPVSGLDEVADAVRSATIPVVPDADHRGTGFTGHLTIARSKGRRLQASTRAAVAGVPFSAACGVHSFDLVASQLAPEGRRYTTVARIPLPR